MNYTIVYNMQCEKNYKRTRKRSRILRRGVQIWA